MQDGSCWSFSTCSIGGQVLWCRGKSGEEKCGEWIMRSLCEFDISTIVLNDRLSLAWPQPQERARQDAEQLLFLSCLHSEK
jgi:hypothetical protein